MKSMTMLLACASLVALPSLAHGQQVPFSDQLVQAPELGPPSRGSLVGQYASIAFGPGDVSRGSYALPLPIELLEERGAIGASPIPSYAADGAISEWGAGWTASNTAIYRTRISGDLDYATDERTGPWGRMIKGTDGAFYPDGLASMVRVEESGEDLVAYLPDGSVWTFDGTIGITTTAGVYSWYLRTVVTVLGRTTTYAYTKNASGRPFLSTVSWGGTVAASPEYELAFDYEPLALSLVDYRSGKAVLLDQRIKVVHARAKSGGAFVERHTWSLGYTQDGASPTFYLATVAQTFAVSGQTAPTATYGYSLSRSYFSQVTSQRVPKLDSVLQTYGANTLFPNRSANLDIDLDGRPDLEIQYDNRVLKQTDTGYEIEALPPASPTANPLCRHPASAYNLPRVLARMQSSTGAPDVVALVANAAQSQTEMVVCDRAGETLWQTALTGNWSLGPNTRLVDLNRDHLPDLIRVYPGGYQAIANKSTASGLALGAAIQASLSPVVQMDTTWVHDLNGDGLPDLLSRSSAGVVAWMGTGHLQFDPTGKTFPIFNSAGQVVPSLASYQFVFFDANNDGITDLLLSNGKVLMLFANNGTSFGQVSVPVFSASAWSSVVPVVLDVAGNGNTEIAYVQGGLAYAIDLDAPGVGLLSSADDGRGTVLTFGYQRALPEVGVRYRNSLLSQLGIASTGYDPITYGYAFTKPDLHSTGLFLLGYESVARTGPVDSAVMTFSNTDDEPGTLLSSVEQDSLAPNVARVQMRSYDDVTVRGVPWKRPASESKGIEGTSSTPPSAVLDTTHYQTYVDDVCPGTKSVSSQSGTLTTATTYVALAAFAKSLGCVSNHVVLTGAHADATLDFRHEADLGRNAAGQMTSVTLVDALGVALVAQSVAYTPAGQVASVATAGKGTAFFAYASTSLLASVTAADGVVTTVTKRDPLTDALLGLAIQRGGLSYAQSFTFDGQERLSTSWNSLSGATAARPDQMLTYRYASGASPALVETATLLDAAAGTTARVAEIESAAGELLARAHLIPQGWSFDEVIQRSRATRTATRFTKPTSAADIATFDTTSLYADGLSSAATQTSLFGFPVKQSMKLSANVQKEVATALTMSASIVRTDLENDAFATVTTTDADEHVTSVVDPAGAKIQYTYDALGRVRRVLMADSTSHRIDYDDDGRPSRVARDGVATIAYAYQPVTGLLIERTFLGAAGSPHAALVMRRVQSAYDAIGRVTTETDVDATTGATQAFQFYYDGATPASPTTRTQLGLLTAVSGTGYTKIITYRADGKELSRDVHIDNWREIETDLTYAADGFVSGRTSIVRDGAGKELTRDTEASIRDAYGRVIAVQHDGHPFATATYDANGLPSTAVFAAPYAHGETAALSYDPLTRLRIGTTLAKGTWSSAVSQHMNDRALVDSESIAIGTFARQRSYGYAAQGFLAQSSDADATYAYAYDSAGLPKRITSTVGGAVDDRPFVRTGYRLAAGSHHHLFDDLGRAIERDAVDLTYGPNGQVSHASVMNTLVHVALKQWDYLYAEDGSRLAKLVGGSPVAAYLDDGSYLDATARTLPVTFGGDAVVGVLIEPTTPGLAKSFQLTVTDARGSVLADADGTPHLPSPFGDRAQHPDVAAAIDYATKGWDADLGTVRMGVRDYDPALSRFLTADPLYLENPSKCVAKSTECNLYGYARNAPMDFVDATGLDTLVLHGGGPGKADGVRVLAQTARELFAPGTPVIVPNDVHASKPGESMLFKRDPSFAAAYAIGYEHPLDSQKNLVGFSLGGDAAIMAAAAGPPSAKGACATQWDNVVVVGARVDRIMANIEDAAKNSSHLVIVNLVNDKYTWPVGSDAVFGDRRFETLRSAITEKYGSVESFEKQHPNVSIQSAIGSHGGAGNRAATQDAVKEGIQHTSDP